MQINSRQRRAVVAGAGPVLIVAGPGTGKTKTLTARIAHLIEQGTAPEHILALTFTNKAAKAAREMRERVTALLPAEVLLPHISTFHAFCHEVLRQSGEQIELIPEEQRQELLRRLKQAKNLKGLTVRELGLKISRAKNAAESPDPDAEELLKAYDGALAARRQCDFDDLLLRLRQLLTDDAAFRKKVQQTYRAILVDEFQDTNSLQYDLLELLNLTDNLFVIGDPLQSIYGFRGAHAGIFDQFLQDWPGALRVQLTTNYRSAAEIVRLGCAVFPDTPPLNAHRGAAGQARAIQVLNEHREADWIVTAIEQEIGGSTMLRGSEHHTGQGRAQSFRDFAVLYRSHALARNVRQRLEASGMPCQVAGEGSPYERPDVKAILNGLAYCNGSGELAPFRKLSARQLVTLFAPLKATAGNVRVLASAIAEKLGLEMTGELRQFLNGLARFDSHGAEAYLEHLETIADQAFYDPAADAITLLTIHASKGLEFRHVFLIGAEEGSLPHMRPGHEPDLDEERRLFYVAVTRARDRLDILHAQKRSGQPAMPSRFITSLSPDTLPRSVDEGMAKQVQQAQKRARRQSQTSLF